MPVTIQSFFPCSYAFSVSSYAMALKPTFFWLLCPLHIGSYALALMPSSYRLICLGSYAHSHGSYASRSGSFPSVLLSIVGSYAVFYWIDFIFMPIHWILFVFLQKKRSSFEMFAIQSFALWVFSTLSSAAARWLVYALLVFVLSNDHLVATDAAGPFTNTYAQRLPKSHSQTSNMISCVLMKCDEKSASLQNIFRPTTTCSSKRRGRCRSSSRFFFNLPAKRIPIDWQFCLEMEIVA